MKAKNSPFFILPLTSYPQAAFQIKMNLQSYWVQRPNSSLQKIDVIIIFHDNVKAKLKQGQAGSPSPAAFPRLQILVVNLNVNKTQSTSDPDVISASSV